jgi:signal transduction histidine kinase
LRESPASAEQLLGKLSIEVDDALEQVRSLARGVYPSLLSDRGLGEALRSAALRSPVRITVDADGIGRHSPMIETAVYFCCLEAIQNAMKHADGVGTISVSLAVNGDLHFEVRDDGAGFLKDEVTSSAGLTNMSDRLAAVGGLLVIRTAPGMGTTVSGTVPLSTNGSPAPPARGEGGRRRNGDVSGHTPGVGRAAALSSGSKTTMPYTT